MIHSDPGHWQWHVLYTLLSNTCYIVSAMDQQQRKKPQPSQVVVLGAGVVGLTTAVQIQEAIPTAAVTIIAAEWDEETTSAGAGGLYRVTQEHCPGNDVKVLR